MDLVIDEVIRELEALSQHPAIAGNAYLSKKVLDLAQKLETRNN